MNVLGFSDESVIETSTVVRGSIEIEGEQNTLIIKEVDIYDKVLILQYQIDQLKEVIKHLTNINLNT